MNNSNALAEIQSKYPNCNLLLPAATSVQINPFYKCSVMEVVADTAPSSGDIFSVGKVKTGEDGKGKAIYEEVFSPAKPLLMKLATAAGIQFHPEYTTVIRENTNTYVGKAYGAVRLPDGSYKTHMETKRICLDDEESKYRLEFMDKSIMGIHDWRASKAAAEMFKGEWKQEAEPNQYGKYDKYYVIADSDREKYIERSILVNMTLLRKTASEKAQTGAILRVMSTMCLQAKDGQLNFVGLDGHVLAWDKIDYDGEFELLIPKNTIDKLKTLGLTGEVRIRHSNAMAIFATEDFEICTRLVQGEYYKYQNMFKELPLHTVISRKELLDAMVRAKMCTAEKCPVKFEIAGSQLGLSIKDQTTDYHETVDLQEDISEELTIGFDARLVIETLKAFDCDNVGISLQGPKMPMIVEAEDSDFKTIVLPVAIK